MNEIGAFVKVWMKSRALAKLLIKIQRHVDAPIARKFSSILWYKTHFHCSKVIIICNIECTAKKWSLGLLLKLLELLLEEKVLVSFSQWKWRCFGFTCLVRCCCWSCHSCVGTFLLARNERRNDVWHLLELLEGWSTIVRIYAGIAFVASYSSYAAGFDIFFTENSDCGGSNGVVGQMRRDASP